MKVLIFDFDGTILDTEQCELAAWEFIFNQYGHQVPLEKWHQCVGTDSWEFDPFLHLQSLLDKTIAREQVVNLRQQKLDELLAALKPLPGVLDWIKSSKDFGLKLAIASNSSEDWVHNHLKRLKLIDDFDLIVTRDYIAHLKPDPEIYQLVLKKLDLSAEDALAIEDSYHGVTAANAAGIRCIAVPNKILAQSKFPETFAQVNSLAEISLPDVL